ncbi:FtsP/CotA-like multicopper oxidase with cupredoxin domain [Defluviimonas denitrificans]|jgi:FtsP/CotA-like multicopper oxidase with cupredoxin domain|uniref:FtsP/CotA-like multicopper oxidase with cupredoxin domain n=1 Tax=Albidovulum denitrificans TaxID=404881 RepID=A0A2S8S674_9RHOB|nr:multicopper oxidase domain-containing protein [Defluviimonas denitrificans]PQV56307.1 FtsP/CotA-like multicopper oxidase with cupredoxin domain [Defluviimonas denitrificans]
MTQLTRRGFLAASAAGAASILLPATARAAVAGPAALRATTRVIEVNGKAATVMGLVNAQGGLGLTLDPASRFRAELTNTLDIETIVHWHGQIPPNAQDGVPNTNPMLRPGETRAYDYVARPGTFWMHSHIPEQEIGLLAAPLIVLSETDLRADRQEVVLFLHDFTFRTPKEVLAEVTGGMAMDHGAMDHSAPAAGGMMGEMPGMTMGMTHDMGGMVMDLNDFNFDAYLANDRTLDDPEVIAVEKGGRVRLRVVNGASMTAFWIDLGAQAGRLVAVDGEPVLPLEGRRFPLAPAQRLDIEVDLPLDGAALPVLALREGARERTGIILAPQGADVPRLSPLSGADHPAVSGDMTLELALRAATPLPERPLDNGQMVMLMGAMQPYLWTINGRTWDNRIPVAARSGERVEMMFHNMSMMAHPMHLHGHVFQVVGINGSRFSGAKRDTVLVPPMASVTIAFDAGEAAPWMLHCHQMGHLAAGMMTELAVTA